jgi:hypothetical protein
MKINKEKLRKEIHERHRTLASVRATLDALPDELPGNGHIHTGMWAVYIEIPYDWELYAAIRRILGGDWHSQSVHDQGESGQKFYVLSYLGEYGKDLYITLSPTKEGSNCHLEKVGERTVELFKAVCD